jgi:hypothetical protein
MALGLPMQVNTKRCVLGAALQRDPLGQCRVHKGDLRHLKRVLDRAVGALPYGTPKLP